MQRSDMPFLCFLFFLLSFFLSFFFFFFSLFCWANAVLRYACWRQGVRGSLPAGSTSACTTIQRNNNAEKNNTNNNNFGTNKFTKFGGDPPCRIKEKTKNCFALPKKHQFWTNFLYLLRAWGTPLCGINFSTKKEKD